MMIKSKQRSKNNNQFTKLSKDCKKTWSLIKEIVGSNKSKEQIPTYFLQNGKNVSEYLEIANGFNTFCSNIGSKLASEIGPTNKSFQSFMPENNPNSFRFSRISEMDILRICKEMKPKMSSGADFISTKLLKEIAPLIITPLHYLINISLETGFVPAEMKLAKIVPVFKDGNCHEYTNYRPISLLSSFSKLLERIVSRQLIRFLHINEIFYKHQYGFRAGHSTSHSVLHLTDKIYNSLNQKPSGKTLTIFIDLKKAFDTVNHQILLDKMENYGVRDSANLWFKNYLNDREQFVFINGIESEKEKISCGVPQGSVLGPLLFLLFINDLPNATNFLTLLFADDTTFQVSGTDLNELFYIANVELEKSAVWFKANKLTLNVKKTKFMVFSETNSEIGDNRLKIGDTTIEQVGTNCKEKYFKFVGHVLDDRLSWEGHIEHINKKMASANFGINSSKNFLPLNIRKMLYYSLFESHLNFGNMLWGCAKQTLLRKVETMQKKCIRNVALKSFRSHTEPIFKELQILNFADRLSYNRAIFMHKYRNRKLPTSFSGIFKDVSETKGTQNRHNDYNYDTQPAIKKYLEKFPLKQIIFNWNSLSLELKATANPIEFETMLKQFYLSKYKSELDCSHDCYICNT